MFADTTLKGVTAMKYKVGIGIFAAIMMVCLCYMGSYQYFYGKKEESGRQMSGELQAEPANAGQGSRIGEHVNKGNGYPFYVKLENGLVAIYEEDKKTVFEYTDIPLHHLNEQLERELEDGKYIYGVRVLCDFLENYADEEKNH